MRFPIAWEYLLLLRIIDLSRTLAHAVEWLINTYNENENKQQVTGLVSGVQTRYYKIPPGAGIQFLQSEVNLTIFARGRRPRAKHCQIDRGLKKLSGLREVFVLPYAVTCADMLVKLVPKLDRCSCLWLQRWSHPRLYKPSHHSSVTNGNITANHVLYPIWCSDHHVLLNMNLLGWQEKRYVTWFELKSLFTALQGHRANSWYNKNALGPKCYTRLLHIINFWGQVANTRITC